MMYATVLTSVLYMNMHNPCLKLSFHIARAFRRLHSCETSCTRLGSGVKEVAVDIGGNVQGVAVEEVYVCTVGCKGDILAGPRAGQRNNLKTLAVSYDGTREPCSVTNVHSWPILVRLMMWRPRCEALNVA
ncbi:hypothetical protein CBL_09164 [Carabus blaptoides fortunei]